MSERVPQQSKRDRMFVMDNILGFDARGGSVCEPGLDKPETRGYLAESVEIAREMAVNIGGKMVAGFQAQQEREAVIEERNFA